MSAENEVKSTAYNQHGSIWAAIVLVLLAIVLGAWMFHTKKVVLRAAPGETAVVEVPVFYVQQSAWYGGKSIEISGDPINPEDYSVHQFTCEDDQLTGEQTDRPSTTYMFQAYLTNNCESDVRIEIWWFDGFDLMNSFF